MSIYSITQLESIIIRSFTCESVNTGVVKGSIDLSTIVLKSYCITSSLNGHLYTSGYL